MSSLQDHFLIAMPAMGDSNFNETVTYICKHEADGAIGLVINRPTDVLLEELFRQLSLDVMSPAAAQQPVYKGGPVTPDRGFVLHCSDEAFDKTIESTAAIKVTVSLDILERMASGGGPSPALVALGYAGWGAGQLETELAANAWLSVPAEPEIIFETPPEQRWTASAGLLGVDIHQIANYAGHA